MTPEVVATAALVALILFFAPPLIYALSQDQDDPVFKRWGNIIGQAWVAACLVFGCVAFWAAVYRLAASI